MTLVVDRKEQERLKEVLKHSHIEPFYVDKLQELLNTASKVFEVPGAYITLIEDFNQIVKIKKGVLLEKVQSNDAICYYLLQNKKPLILSDFIPGNSFIGKNLINKMPNLKFYVCTPLISSNQHVLGMLSICGCSKKEFTDTELNKLKLFSEVAVNILETNHFVCSSKWSAKDADSLKEELIALKETRIRKLLELEAAVKEGNDIPVFSMDKKIETKKDSHKQFINAVYLATSSAFPDKNKLTEWSKIVLEESKRDLSQLIFSDFVSGLSSELHSCLAEKGNCLKWESTPGNWKVDTEAFSFILRNMIMNINRRSQNNVITINSFDDEEYAIMVLRHKGSGLAKNDLLKISALLPEELLTPESQELFFIWHTLKILGGFITVPENSSEETFISIGLPKKYFSQRKVA